MVDKEKESNCFRFVSGWVSVSKERCTIAALSTPLANLFRMRNPKGGVLRSRILRGIWCVEVKAARWL